MSYEHLTSAERGVIDRMRSRGRSRRAIARALGRSPSTICRELRRNAEPKGYNPHWARLQYWRRREQKHLRYKTGDEFLMARVVDKLKEGWSPEQVGGRFRHQDYADDSRMWISHETVYRYIWEDKRKGGTLYGSLRRKRVKYGKRGSGRHPNRFITGRVSIDERPSIVTDQGRFGDWEADTIYGRCRKSSMVTVAERKSLFLTAAPIPNASASATNRGVLQCLLPIPKQLIHTVTVDNGKEWVAFKALEKKLQAAVFFTHPYSAWERPINENLNGLLRQYLPRKTDLRSITAEQLEAIVLRLNNRPRKKHNYRTPSEVFSEACVALAT